MGRMSYGGRVHVCSILGLGVCRLELNDCLLIAHIKIVMSVIKNAGFNTLTCYILLQHVTKLCCPEVGGR